MPALGVAAAIVLVLIAVVLGLTLRGKHSSSAAVTLPNSNTTVASAPETIAATTGADITAGATTTAAPVTPSTSPSAMRVVPAQAYDAPGGMTVKGPVGWRNDTSAGIANIRDYDSPASSQRLLGAYFRIGIGNTTPSGAFADEVAQAQQFLQSQYSADTSARAPATFLGAESVDIEYTYRSDSLGVTRHGIERLWRHGGVTLIIQSSDIDARWPQTKALFVQLVASASVA